MTKLLGVFTLALCVPAALLANQAAQDEQDGQGQDERRGRGQRLVGQYEIVEGAKDGEEISAERLKDNTVAITRDTISVVDREKKELFSATYKLARGEERGLWKIDMVSKVPNEGEKAVGLLKRDGEQLWLIYGLDGKRPENFEKTTKGQHLFKMKRQSETPDLNEPAE